MILKNKKGQAEGSAHLLESPIMMIIIIIIAAIVGAGVVLLLKSLGVI